MTAEYYIALENPISMDFSTLILRYMSGHACLAECLKYNPKKRTKIHLIPRPGRSGAPHHAFYVLIAIFTSQIWPHGELFSRDLGRAEQY